VLSVALRAQSRWFCCIILNKVVHNLARSNSSGAVLTITRRITLVLLCHLHIRDGACSDDGDSSDVTRQTTMTSTTSTTVRAVVSSSNRPERDTVSLADHRVHRPIAPISGIGRHDSLSATSVESGCTRSDWLGGHFATSMSSAMESAMSASVGFQAMSGGRPVTTLSAVAAVRPWLHGLGLAAAAAGLVAYRNRGASDIASLVDFASSLK